MNAMTTTRRSNVDAVLGLRKRRYLRVLLHCENRYRCEHPGLAARLRDWLVRVLREREVARYERRRRPVGRPAGNAFRPGARRRPGIVIP